MKKTLYLFLSLAIVSCNVDLPDDAIVADNDPAIYPDYADIAIPWNIAPLNFNINVPGDDFITAAYVSNDDRIVAAGKTVRWNRGEWRELLERNKGETLNMDIYAKRGGDWYRYRTISNYIAPEEIDRYISYRLIEPGYGLYDDLSIDQRDITGFREKVIYANRLARLPPADEGQCINCHSYQDYNRGGRMQFHVRQYKGGTVIVTPDSVQKINLQTGYTISGGVYPAWHPAENLIAYSVNNTTQEFHPADIQKIKVMDRQSDLVLYDLDKNEVRFIADDPDRLETFPAWSPDGKTLYYASAEYPDGVDISAGAMMPQHKGFKYDIFRKKFNPETCEFAEADTVFKAVAIDKSASLPRISPDGRYLLFTLGDYGNFHIWHKSSDLYVMDLISGEVVALAEANSPDVDSYHSWSSNGAWIIFSSRRNDGSYTCPYITYFKDGKGSKAFILPQKDPDYYAMLFKSFNVPEFMTEPVTVSQRELLKAINNEPLQVTQTGNNRQTPADKNDAGGGFYD